MISLVILYFGCSVLSSKVSWTSLHSTQDQHFVGGSHYLQNSSSLQPIRRSDETKLGETKGENNSTGSFITLPALNSKPRRKLSFSELTQNLSVPDDFSVRFKNTLQPPSNLNLQPVSSTLVSVDNNNPTQPVSSTLVSVHNNNSALMEQSLSRQKRLAYSCKGELRNSGDITTERNWFVKVTAYASKLPYEIKAVVYMCCVPGTFLVNVTASSSELGITSTNTWETFEIKMYRRKVGSYHEYLLDIERQSLKKRISNTWADSYGIDRIEVSITGVGVQWFKSTNCTWMTSTALPPLVTIKRLSTTTTDTTTTTTTTTAAAAAAADPPTTTTTTISASNVMKEDPVRIHLRPNVMTDTNEASKRDEPSSRSQPVVFIAVTLVLVVIIIILVVVIIFLKRKYNTAQRELRRKSADASGSREEWQALQISRSLPTSFPSQMPRDRTLPASPADDEAIYEDPPECSTARYISVSKNGYSIT